MTYFNTYGRRANTGNYRTFDNSPKDYYAISKVTIDYQSILKNSKLFGGVENNISLSDFETTCNKLKEDIKKNPDFHNLLQGCHIPFICRKIDSVADLGKDLELTELPNYQRSFNSQFPDAHFKAVLQSNSQLVGNIKLDPRSRYQEFLENSQRGVVVGWFFPQALQEFDIESQRKQMATLPRTMNVCLSGGVDIIASLIGTPDLLINKETYSPILCMSSYVHADPRLVLIIKAYGPHMEFWCMTQMLTREITQVSEQWAGGLTIYSRII